MTDVSLLIVVVTIVFAVAVLAGVAWFVIDSMVRVRRFARSTDVLPGRPGTAPREWAASDDPAPLLHRRLRYAIALVHENHTLRADPVSAAALERLDDAVLALDGRLVAVGTGSVPGGDDALAPFDDAISALERLPGRLVYQPPGVIAGRVDETIAYLADPSLPLDTGESPYSDDESS
ncbi:hypothetical protein ASG12_08885 [Williamsia sp. Leaf354]|uniref:hypothetical protein n=1 Tax=Williamsia sp. Leaf354 TaxID=1736349 RepID=UPI000700417F|nr:hypothetical protein [Williamsia sp. Leaf354]KQR98542.1 hypothetical protein ASG12_08885 [Williamsia sp. Leaf354]